MSEEENSPEQINERINELGDLFIAKVTQKIRYIVEADGELHDYRIVWKQLEDIASPEIKAVLEEEFPSCVVTLASSKSTYPDIKFEYRGVSYAIDIKTHEDQKNPWYDIGRLDTYREKRLDKYEEEWELVIKYDSETQQFLSAYFDLVRHIVGRRNKANCVKYRPYDGK